MVIAGVTGCALPAMSERTESAALPIQQTEDTRLGRAIAPALAEHGDKSGIVTLADPYDAFAARVLLAEGADASLDVQYYIWRYDISGRLLLNALYRAAQRGVRVRLLLDDNGIADLDQPLSALDGHPNIEVRLFNPFPTRSAKWLGYLSDFSRLNHRMHNKSFTADNQAAIIGGRNVADEYFGAGYGALFADLDILAIGPVVDDLSADFDRYWSSASAYPAELLLPDVEMEELTKLIESAQALEQSPEATAYVRSVADSGFMSRLFEGNLRFTWAPVTMVSDDPAKALGDSDDDKLMSRQLVQALGEPTSSFTLVSPYFIPGKAGLALFRDLESKGVEVRVLTNSLEANDVALVHAGYAKYRKPLLEAGVELFEMRKLDEGKSLERGLQSGLSGSSSSSLHAKTFAVDGDTLFVGSFNFDPRSTHLNTELGFIIESRELAGMLDTLFDEQVASVAYEVVLDDDGDLQWIERNGDEVVRHSHDPEAGAFKRGMVFVFSLLPIEGLL
ncbi:phospholipase D family protein [Marinobacter sp. M216]|uniref:Phospholipase D family protein n=2 Tax=Marinobacteraceae TaxID=2887365 RepID=A0ABT7HE56_9GAMM|nr:phospholipase D family protein [Marinobacter sp. M216]MBW7471773.1 phospholipase D family protein [Marinobacter sp. F4218]MDK9558342.1 phospholipase D family protein [Marinobacter sp. M216]